MPSQITNYQCPACTGPLHFVGSTGKLQCDYCGSVFDVADIEARMAEKDASASEAFQRAEQKSAENREKQSGDGETWDTSALNSDWGADAAGMRTLSCPSCGAELICDASTAATGCPYCGNPAIVPGQFSGALKPDLVIPFRLDREAAVAALKKHYGGRPFLPKSFRNENHIQEIKGVYVPFWLYDGTADADAEFEATTSSSHREGDYEVTVTRHFRVHRSGDVEFEKVPVDASSQMPDDHMDSIEPFDYKEFKPFSTAYLPGFLADRYDVSAEECAARADERCKRTALQKLEDTVTGYETCAMRRGDVRLYRGKVHYALMPVWMLSTRWNGKNFLFAMNGQTGKFVGDLPMSWGKFWLTFAAAAVPIAAAMFWFFYR